MAVTLPWSVVVVAAVLSLLLLIPWLVAQRHYLPVLGPELTLDQARDIRRVRRIVVWPATVVFGAAGALWIGTPHGVVAVVYAALVIRLVAAQARSAAVSYPALTRHFPTAAVPLVGWSAAALLAYRLTVGWPTGFWSVLGPVVAVVAPPTITVMLATIVGDAVIAARRRVLRRRLAGRWIRSKATMVVTQAVPAADAGVLLTFSTFPVVTPLPGHAVRPFFVVLASHEPHPRPPDPGRVQPLWGPGSATTAEFLGGQYGQRTARVDLGDEVVALVQENTLSHLDNFGEFLASLETVGRRPR